MFSTAQHACPEFDWCENPHDHGDDDNLTHYGVLTTGEALMSQMPLHLDSNEYATHFYFEADWWEIDAACVEQEIADPRNIIDQYEAGMLAFNASRTKAN